MGDLNNKSGKGQIANRPTGSVGANSARTSNPVDSESLNKRLNELREKSKDKTLTVKALDDIKTEMASIREQLGKAPIRRNHTSVFVEHYNCSTTARTGTIVEKWLNADKGETVGQLLRTLLYREEQIRVGNIELSVPQERKADYERIAAEQRRAEIGSVDVGGVSIKGL